MRPLRSPSYAQESAPGCAFALHPDTIDRAFSSDIQSRWDGLAILNGELPDEPDDE